LLFSSISTRDSQPTYRSSQPSSSKSPKVAAWVGKAGSASPAARVTSTKVWPLSLRSRDFRIRPWSSSQPPRSTSASWSPSLS
jgi:hypothetical protein